MNHPIIIANKTIRSDSYERFCLNDLHKAAGGQPRHIPSKWLRTQQVKDLIDEIEISQIRAIETKQKTGTFGCRELIYAYATWISPAFFLKVIRAFDALATGTLSAPQAPALPEVLTPTDLNAMLDKPMQITVREYLALTQGKGDPQAALQAGHSNGQHYSDEIRAQVLDLGDKGWMPAEISERTGVPKDTVSTMLFRARKAGKIAKGPKQGTLARDAKRGVQ
jgi:hypothetical protein